MRRVVLALTLVAVGAIIASATISLGANGSGHHGRSAVYAHPRAWWGMGPPPSAAQRAAFEKQIEQRCTTFTNAVAGKLSIDGSKLRDAIKAVIHDDIEKAVSDGKLTRARADKIESRLASASCVMPLPGPHGFRGHGPDGDGPPPPPPGAPPAQ